MSRLKSSRGMTFMELLCAVLILMMSTALVLVGVNLALTTYRANMEASEAQVLYSTLTTVISCAIAEQWKRRRMAPSPKYSRRVSALAAVRRFSLRRTEK